MRIDTIGKTVTFDPELVNEAKMKTGCKNNEELATLVGRSVFTVYKWQRGDSIPKLTDLITLAHLAGRENWWETITVC